MITVLVIVLVIEALSLLMLFLNIQLFRTQSEKYRMLLSGLGNESTWGKPGRIIIPLYVLTTLFAALITGLVFVFQPHLL